MNHPKRLHLHLRIKLIHGLLMLVFLVFGIRLFSLQVLRGSYYAELARNDQQKQFQIPAARGSISARDGAGTVLLVLNELRYRLVIDPTLVIGSDKTISELVLRVITPADEIKEMIERKDSRYQIIAKDLTRELADEIKALELPGVFLEQTPARTYPQNELAAQVLGFVDDSGEGKYGVEQFLNAELAGTAGRVKAITDQRGVPLLASGDNVEIAAVDGTDIVLTIDVNIQRQLEEILKAGLEHAKSESGGALILNANNGEVVAMANLPSYNPAEFKNVEDPSLFTNAIVGSPFEPGSIMKTLTMSAALDQGVIAADHTYYDPGFWKIDNETITNVVESAGSGTRSLYDILRLSLNTGAVHMLMMMGGGEVNEQARTRWHDYMVNHYQLGKLSGIEQGYEEGGDIPNPTDGYGLNIQYANTVFGQGMTATPLQMAAALASVVNGGTYYKPHLVAEKIKNGTSELTETTIVKDNAVKPEVGPVIIGFMEQVVAYNNLAAKRAGYSVGGKTGTAQIPNAGTYYTDRFNGTYMGFVGGNKPEYVIIVRVNEPHIGGYAGTKAAAPIFASLSNMLINNFNVPSKVVQ